MNFPKKLYVKIDGDKNEQYFIADPEAESMVEIGVRVKIATYQLVTVEIGETFTKLTPLSKRR